MIVNKEFFSCEEHIDMAIDDYVNYEGEAPEVLRDSGHKCKYCDNVAVYVVKQPEEFL
jgi:CxxH/CxxC protein (TIGR04129 family)